MVEPGDPSSIPSGTAFGPYRVRGLIARGGMGAVYRVYHVDLRADFALKVVRRDLTDAQLAARFRREAEVMAGLDWHPGIIGIHTFGVTPRGDPYYVMDLIEGSGTLWRA